MDFLLKYSNYIATSEVEAAEIDTRIYFFFYLIVCTAINWCTSPFQIKIASPFSLIQLKNDYIDYIETK